MNHILSEYFTITHPSWVALHVMVHSITELGKPLHHDKAVIHTVNGFNVVNEAEIDVFLEFPYFLHDLTNVGNLISGSWAFSKPSLYIWNFLVHVLLKPSLKDFEHNLTSMWNEHNSTLVWTFFGIVLLWDWNENWAFPVLWPLLSFLNLLTHWVQHFNNIVF